MAQTKLSANDEQNNQPEQGITRISVSGYKSLAEECSIEIAPLTILSGANSSGKSSIMQPLLLMKQTLESAYDAGSLKLNGANVRLTSTDQIFTKNRIKNSSPVTSFFVSIDLNQNKTLVSTFKKDAGYSSINLSSSIYKYKDIISMSLHSGMQHKEILKGLPSYFQAFYHKKYDEEKKIWQDFKLSFEPQGIIIFPSPSLYHRTTLSNSPKEGFVSTEDLTNNPLGQRAYEKEFRNHLLENLDNIYRFSVKINKCFLFIDFQFLLSTIFYSRFDLELNLQPYVDYSDLFNFFDSNGLSKSIENQIRKLIHVPGLRGNPERTYPVTAVGNEFTGTFENYVASIIHSWKITKDKRLKLLGEALQTLGLTWKVDTKQIDDTQVEVRVGRLKNKGNSQSTDMVSIADVGFGLSQTLPVVVALLVAEPEQLVYLEQPEIHLHPRAQANLAQLLVDAANRGVRAVVETHSELLIRRVQSLIAEDKIAAEKVKLHWFSQDDNGFTKVTTAELDETGAFGDWPEDFSEISLQEESRYLDAAESKLMAV